MGTATIALAIALFSDPAGSGEGRPMTTLPRHGESWGEVSVENTMASTSHPMASNFERPDGRTPKRDDWNRTLCATDGCVGPVPPGKTLCGACRERAIDLKIAERYRAERKWLIGEDKAAKKRRFKMRSPWQGEGH